MKNQFKKLLVAVLTAFTLTAGMLSTLIGIALPFYYWYVWIPCAIISYLILVPAIEKWRRTWNSIIGVETTSEEK